MSLPRKLLPMIVGAAMVLPAGPTPKSTSAKILRSADVGDIDVRSAAQADLLQRGGMFQAGLDKWLKQ